MINFKLIFIPINNLFTINSFTSLYLKVLVYIIFYIEIFSDYICPLKVDFTKLS